MSVLVNFAMFPTDSGTSVSKYVSKIIQMIDQSGVSYKLNPMGTSFETESMKEALALIEKSYDLLKTHSRVYAVVNFDIQNDKSNRISSKMQSIEDKIGKVRT
ncbi:MAG: hypothetical protein B7C24_01380 [Bacteroidetes bacterium 4572_77]|nr:MAG: hypothetical protein B7C24_01380 [Bacteroidetes bacterium 4572_77]